MVRRFAPSADKRSRLPLRHRVRQVRMHRLPHRWELERLPFPGIPDTPPFRACSTQDSGCDSWHTSLTAS